MQRTRTKPRRRATVPTGGNRTRRAQDERRFIDAIGIGALTTQPRRPRRARCQR